jgi:beta-galactosidase
MADDKELNGDGRDATRVVFLVTDEYGNIRPLATGVIVLALTGPGEIIGENPFALADGTGAITLSGRSHDRDRRENCTRGIDLKGTDSLTVAAR